MVLQLFSKTFWPVYSVGLLILYTIGRTPWKGDETVARQLPTHRTKVHTTIPRCAFELAISEFEREKTDHDFDPRLL